MKWWHVVLIIVAFQIVEAFVLGSVGAVALAAKAKVPQ